MYALIPRSNSWKYLVLSIVTFFLLIAFIVWCIDSAATQECLLRQCYGQGIGRLVGDTCICAQPS